MQDHSKRNSAYFLATIYKIWMLRYVDVPEEVGRALKKEYARGGSKARKVKGERGKYIPVVAIVNGRRTRTTLVPAGAGLYRLQFNATLRKAARADVGKWSAWRSSSIANRVSFRFLRICGLRSGDGASCNENLIASRRASAANLSSISAPRRAPKRGAKDSRDSSRFSSSTRSSAPPVTVSSRAIESAAITAKRLVALE
jgi:hypothetical protein